MEESIDPATSSLLCLENNDTCFDEFECNVADGSPSWDHKNLNFNNQCLIKDNHGSKHFLDFLVQSDETVLGLIGKEREHLPRDDYLKRLLSGDLDLSVRREALDWIWKAHAYYGFGPCSFCLSVNYLDRFLSVYELPRGKSWSVQLLAIACLSIAAKMDETKVPPCVDLQVGEPKFVFEAKTIQRMELLVLGTLRWKMQALTPCSFLDYFLKKITCDQLLVNSSILRSVGLILNMIRCINFLEFRPSEIAAAVAISVLRELQAEEIEKALTCFVIVEKGRILKCLELIKDLSLIQDSANLGSNLAPFVPQSPIGVLDAACLSSISDELTVGSCTDSSFDTSNSKRRKYD
ncbi:Cyclin-D3-1 protein [Spatholobus suberectus]|nr:Cyclin-D3-1 protein [Spatholobus suberectus]